MVNYRRAQTPGGTYFFTVTLQDRRANHLVTYITHLHNAIRQVQRQKPFDIIAAVFLPEHLHMIARLPENDSDYPGRWRAIKSLFTRALVKEGVGITQNHRGEYNLWQRRYWEHQIRDENDLRRHVDYIHYNPVKHGYVKRVADWPHSTFHRFVRLSSLAPDWGGNVEQWEGGRFGE